MRIRFDRLRFLTPAVVACAATLVISATMAGQFTTTFVETFDDAGNEGAWTFGTGLEFYVADGGNPGWYLRDDSLVSFTPKASTSFGVVSEFTGDWAARGVTSVGIDLATADVSSSAAGRTITLVVLNDNGTPLDLEDDWGAFIVTDLPVPSPGVIGLAPEVDLLGWESYDIAVPATSPRLPDGWQWISAGGVRPGGPWQRLMHDVDHVGFVYGDPRLLYLIQSWDVAMDNPRITFTN